MTRLVALIRGINVGSTRKLPMAELRAACAQGGLGQVETYIQSGNIVLEGDDPIAVEAALETLIDARFGLSVPVMVRTAGAWAMLAAACPFIEAREEPGRVMLLTCKAPPAADVVETLTARARDGERIARCVGELAIHFPNGSGASRLTPTLIDRLAGSPATARNWTTVLKLAEMAGG